MNLREIVRNMIFPMDADVFWSGLEGIFNELMNCAFMVS